MRQQRSSKYAKISLKKRQKLVNCVIENNMSVSKAATRLGICVSTAKMIVKRFRAEGTFFESRSDKGKRLLRPKNRESSLNSSELGENVRISPQIHQEYQQNHSTASGIIPLMDSSHMVFFGDCYIHPWMFFGNLCSFTFGEWQH